MELRPVIQQRSSIMFTVLCTTFGLGACMPASIPAPLPTVTQVPPTATLAPTRVPMPTLTLTPTLIPHPSPTSTPVSDTTSVFTDDFTSSCILPKEDDVDHTYKCENGEYTMLLKTADSARWVFYPIPFDDAVVEMNARVISGSGDIEYGVVLRMSKDGNNGYVFGLTNNGEYGAYLYSSQGWIELVSPTASSAVKTGTAKNRLKLIAQRNQIAFYVNDQFLNTVTDSTLSEGFGGFYFSGRSPNVKVAFSDLSVSQINRPLTLPRPKPTPTPEIPAIPAGLGGLIVINRNTAKLTRD